MEENYDILISVLEASVKKNGEKPLTNQYLLNILKKLEIKLKDLINTINKVLIQIEISYETKR